MTEREEKAKEWLNRNFGKAMEIEALKRRIERMESDLERSVKPLRLKEVQEEPEGNSHEEKLAEFIDLKKMLEVKILELGIEDQKTIKVILQIDQAISRTILIERYINRLSWKEIAKAMHFSPGGGHLYNMHRDALCSVLPFIPREAKE
jgi:DNA-directed RNA polymerase specialized sigma subunit